REEKREEGSEEKEESGKEESREKRRRYDDDKDPEKELKEHSEQELMLWVMLSPRLRGRRRTEALLHVFLIYKVFIEGLAKLLKVGRREERAEKRGEQRIEERGEERRGEKTKREGKRRGLTRKKGRGEEMRENRGEERVERREESEEMREEIGERREEIGGVRRIRHKGKIGEKCQKLERKWCKCNNELPSLCFGSCTELCACLLQCISLECRLFHSGSTL
ncbi:uncharacterized protein, partial [Dendrobates tinctorius]|uniref:uncharacterized protein n=1 Tax=Dendrobates tinctorius TaxID=92724 RepID=UPI003CC9E12E